MSPLIASSGEGVCHVLVLGRRVEIARRDRSIVPPLSIVRYMRYNRSVPPATVVPILVYPDVRAAVAWLTTTFGFVERTRIGDSHRAQMSIGTDGAVIVADVRGELRPPQEGFVTHSVRVRVDDVDAHCERARALGARVLEPPTDREYGERDCTVEDLAGHRWHFSETVKDVAPEEFGCETVSGWPQSTWS
jgi:uncharacterized glyoxalase superfamily protein PhnB